nr:hypothetical protein [Tanacetum cinerariifolium]
MANPPPNHVVNLPDDEQVQPEPAPALLRFAPAVLDIPNNNNGWIDEDPKMEEEEEEMEIEDEMNDPEIINPYEIEEGELSPLPAESDTSSYSEPEVKAEDEDENEAATVGTITSAPYHVQLFSGNTYVGSGSSRKVFAPGPIGKDVNILHRKSVSALEDQMRGLMLEDKEEKERLKKKLKVSQKKEQMEQTFRHVVDWIRKHFGVEIPPCMDDGDVTTPNKAHPYKSRGSPLSIGNKMHKAIPLPGIEFPLAEEVPIASEEGYHCQKKREATARKIALLSKSKRNCQSKSNDSFTKLVPHVTPCILGITIIVTSCTRTPSPIKGFL